MAVILPNPYEISKCAYSEPARTIPREPELFGPMPKTPVFIGVFGMYLLSRAAEPTLVLNEVDEHIVAQSFRGGEKGTALIDFCEPFDELT